MLAMDDNDKAGFLGMGVAHTFIVSKLAPARGPKNCRLKFKRLLKSSKLSKRLKSKLRWTSSRRPCSKSRPVMRRKPPSLLPRN